MQGETNIIFFLNSETIKNFVNHHNRSDLISAAEVRNSPVWILLRLSLESVWAPPLIFLIFFSDSAYFDAEGQRKGYDIEDVELLIRAKYEEATGCTLDPDPTQSAIRKEKELIITALEAFQESEDTETKEHKKTYKRQRRRLLAHSVGKTVVKWKKNIHSKWDQNMKGDFSAKWKKLQEIVVKLL